MKKLAKSFVASRVSNVTVLPSWDIKPVLGKVFFQLNMQMSKIKDMKEELTPLFGSTDMRSILSFMMEDENEGSSKLDKSYSLDALQRPDFILKIDLSLNDLTIIHSADLAPFVQLRSLDASFNCIEDFSGIVTCTQLTSLKLSYNNIEKLPLIALAECKHLIHVDLCSNKISDVSQFPVMPNLRSLNLSHNKLKNVNGLHVLPFIKEIHLQHNKINNIVGISACMTLERVDLSYNRIEQAFDVVDIFRHIHGMKQLDLAGNPGKLDESLMILLAKTTSINISDGVHVGPLRHSFVGIDKVAAPSSSDPLKMELKYAVEEAMIKSSRHEDSVYERQLSFLHSKILTLNVEHQQYNARNGHNLELWFRYIDGLSEDEAQALSTNKLQTFPWTSEAMGKAVTKPKQKPEKKMKLPHVPTDTTKLLTVAASVLRHSLE